MHVIKAVCLLLGVHPKVGAQLEDYWHTGKQELLSKPQFLQMLLAYDKDHIDKQIIASLDGFISELCPDNIGRVSFVADALCRWVHAMHSYHNTSNSVMLKKCALHIASSHLDAVMPVVKARRERLCIVETDIAEMCRVGGDGGN